jgi:hypothetical protein
LEVAVKRLALALALLAAPLSAQTATVTIQVPAVVVRDTVRVVDTVRIVRVDTVRVVDTVFVPVPAPIPPDSTPASPGSVPTPPVGVPVLWSADWRTPGTGAVTYTDSGLFNAQAGCGGNTNVMTIISGAPLGWNVTPNVARITIPTTTTNCTGVEIAPVPGLALGQSYFVRMYARSDATSDPTLHPVTIHQVGNIQAVLWSIRNVTAAGYRPVFQTDYAAGSGLTFVAGGSCDIRWAPASLLPSQTWHRFEWHVEFVNVRANDADVRLWPRVYDLAGTLLYDAATYRRAPGWCGSTTQTLAQFYAAGGLLRFDDLSQTRAFGVGYEGKTGVAVGSTWYYAAPAVGTAGWIGPR